MKLVFQLADQKHFMCDNKQFILLFFFCWWHNKWQNVSLKYILSILVKRNKILMCCILEEFNIFSMEKKRLKRFPNYSLSSLNVFLFMPISFSAVILLFKVPFWLLTSSLLRTTQPIGKFIFRIFIRKIDFIPVASGPEATKLVCKSNIIIINNNIRRTNIIENHGDPLHASVGLHIIFIYLLKQHLNGALSTSHTQMGWHSN